MSFHFCWNSDVYMLKAEVLRYITEKMQAKSVGECLDNDSFQCLVSDCGTLTCPCTDVSAWIKATDPWGSAKFPLDSSTALITAGPPQWSCLLRLFTVWNNWWDFLWVSSVFRGYIQVQFLFNCTVSQSNNNSLDYEVAVKPRKHKYFLNFIRVFIYLWAWPHTCIYKE